MMVNELRVQFPVLLRWSFIRSLPSLPESGAYNLWKSGGPS